VQSNIVVFEAMDAVYGTDFVQQMDARGVRLGNRGGQKVRAVTHRMVSAADIDEALERIRLLASERGQGFPQESTR